MQYKLLIVLTLVAILVPRWAEGKELSLSYKDPVKDSLSNTHVTYSATHLFALGSEVLFKELGSQNSSAVRLGEYLFFAYGTAFLSSFSHEWSHYRLANFYNLSPKIKINIFGGEVRHFFTANIDDSIRITTAGLNQQELNAGFVFEKIVLSGSVSYINGTSLMMNRFGTLAYSLVTVGGYDSTGSDIINYELLTQAKGFRVDRYEMLAFSLLSVLSSAVIWQNLSLGHDFVADNKRQTPLLLLWDTVVPPLFQYYLTEYGDMITMILPVVRPTPIFLWAGLGLRQPFYRVGLRAYVIHNEKLSLIPSFYYNRVKNSNLTGYLLGFEAQFHLIPRKWSLFFITKYSENDIIDQLKIESGYYATVGGSLYF
ncbi:MAG TPA: hypothetical protein ENI73_09355 [Spirochaetes bacterium]|nr:hypothetical protein [Spirochaetota bacterium]